MRSTLLLAALLLAGCAKPPPAKPTGPAVVATPESWCPEGFEPGANNTCFALPRTTNPKTPILLYLHGMFSGQGSSDEWSNVRYASDKGFAVILPRGRRGMCAWKAEAKDAYCWPGETEEAADIESVIAEWEKVLWQVEALLEPGTHKRYVVGYANGGYFANHLATQGAFPAAAYVVIGGGELHPPKQGVKPAPLLLVTAEHDPAEGQKMVDLRASLEKAGWLHARCTRPGERALSKDDIDLALRFFQKTDPKDNRDAKVTMGLGCEGLSVAQAGDPTPAKPPKDVAKGQKK